MLTLVRTCSFAILLLIISADSSYGQVKIGDNPTTINTNSLLELESSTKGLLLPRLTTDQIKAMTNVPEGMLVFNSTDSALVIKRDTGWASMALTSGKDAATNRWGVNGNNMYNKNSGNVGIGTTTPTEKFTVRASGKGISQESPNGTVKVGFYTTDGSAYLQTHSNHKLYFGTNNNSPQMTLATDGKLGIGTTTPTEKLDVSGNVKVGGDITYTGNLNMGLLYRTSEFSVSGNSRKLYQLGCPSGTKVIAGGGGHAVFNSAATDITINSSFPDVTANAWTLYLHNDLGDSRGCFIYTICAKVE